MKALPRTLYFLAAAMMASGSVTALEIGVNAMNERELPVLVQVSATGEVTRVLPAIPLSPALARVLQDTIRHWVTGPAIGQNRQPIASSMIMRVSLFANTDHAGKRDVWFEYVSGQATPMAGGGSYWSWNGNQLALVIDPGLRDPSPWRGYRGDRIGIPWRNGPDSHPQRMVVASSTNSVAASHPGSTH